MSAVRGTTRGAISPDLRALVDSLPMAVALTADDGKVLYANREMQGRAGRADPARLPDAQVCPAPWGRCVCLPPVATPDPQMQRLASMGFMLAGVCHEVSNPLAAIHSMIQILQSPRGVSPGTLEKGLDTIAGNVVRVLGITRKLGNFSRATGEAPQAQPIDAAVNEARALLRHSRWGDAVEVRYHGIPGAVTRSRPGELQQVLFNVMLNAAQAMQGTGRIDVRVERDGSEAFRVLVKDSGPGIPAQDLPRIFEPFFTTKPPGEGTGLGLAICYEIMHELGGSIRVSNRPEGGVCIDLALPKAA